MNIFGFGKWRKLASKLSDEASWILTLYKLSEDECSLPLLKVLAQAYNEGLPVNASVVKILRDKGMIR